MSVLVRGLAIDRHCRPALAGSAPASVESCFPHAINLTAGPAILTLVSSGGRPAPGTIITDAREFGSFPRGEPAALTPTLIQLGSLSISLDDPAEFSCHAAPPSQITPATVGKLRRMRDRVHSKGSFLLRDEGSTYERALQRRLEEGRALLSAGLRSALAVGPDGVLLERAVRGLIGLGAGLTPSGDDYLVGILSVLHHLPTGRAPSGRASERELRQALGQRVRDGAVLTTTVSGHFLRAAADGRFHADIAAATVAALTDADTLEAAFARVTGIGSTSGTDALFGLVDAVDALSAAPFIQTLEGTLK